MELNIIIEQLNSIISKENWLDMEVQNLSGGVLVVAGSTDFTYGHSLEIEFHDVFYMSLNMEWKTDTSKPVFHNLDYNESLSLNSKFQIEKGFSIVKIIAEDFSEPFYVAAKSLFFNTDKVYYYHKDNLGPNERIASWVK